VDSSTPSIVACSKQITMEATLCNGYKVMIIHSIALWAQKYLYKKDLVALRSLVAMS